MARIARVVLPGLPYHVTHRGNRRGRVFFDVADRRRYLRLLREWAGRARLRVWAYALMPNHVHLVVVPERVDSNARGIGIPHRRHSAIVHVLHGWAGHLWANRHFSTPLDETHLWAAVRYVELNPVRAGIVRSAHEYRWSSARAHALGATDPVLDPGRPFPGDVADWSRWIHEGTKGSCIEEIRRNTRTGRPTGSKAFIDVLEKRLGRSLRPGKRGPRRSSPRRARRTRAPDLGCR